jgi:cell division transport system permease protein
MNIWLKSHKQAIKLVISRMRANVKSTLLIAIAIGVAMCLPGLFYLTVDHFSQFSHVMENENEISVFIALDADASSVSEINTQLANHPQIKSHRLVPKTEAWAAMQAKSDDQSAALLTENPLPDAFYVLANSNAPDALESLKNDLANIQQVDHVLLNTDWSKRLAAILLIAKKVIYFIALLLAIGLIVIVGNTIRMQIITQRDEIEVSYLIGATNSFIRTSFLYAGVFYGLFGGIISIAIIAFCTNRFNHYVQDLSALYSSDLSLGSVNLPLLLTILAAAIIIGWVGSYLAVNRALSSIVSSSKSH